MIKTLFFEDGGAQRTQVHTLDRLNLVFILEISIIFYKSMIWKILETTLKQSNMKLSDKQRAFGEIHLLRAEPANGWVLALH